MSQIERLRRPEPVRRAPIRQLGALAAREVSAESEAAAPPAGAPPPAPEAPTSGPSLGAGLGYRVIEDYLRQGREAAERLGSGFAGSGLDASFQGLSQRMLRDGLLWLEYVTRAWSVLDVPRAAAPGGDASPAQGGAVSVRLDARAPAELTLELRPGAAGRRLGVHPLRCPDPGVPALEEAEVGAGGEGRGARVALRIPDGQAPGLYSAVVYDRTDGSVQGTLSVCVGAQKPR
jgi:hypothetical protein